MEIIPKLDERSDTPLYIQLYMYFKHEIEISALKTNIRIPSIRYMADSLHISRTTVQMAYQQLVAEGYLISKARSGYYVVNLNDDQTVSLARDNGNCTNLSACHSEQHADNILYDFFMSDIDTVHFPLIDWKKCLDRLLAAPQKDFFTYGAHQGEPELRETLSEYLHRSRGVQCRPEQIVIAAGTQSILKILYRLIHWKYQILAMEDPGYRGVRRSLAGENIQMMPIPVDKDGLSIEKLKNIKTDALYITPSHQYPMGMVMPITNRICLLSWANETSSWIIEDDYDGEFRYRGKPIPSLQSIDKHQRTIYIGTFSKSLMPAIRISYMVLPWPLLDIYHSMEWRQTASRLHQRTLALFIEDGYWDRHIRRMRTLYRRKQAVLLDIITSVMGEHVDIGGQDAGLHIVLYVKSNHSAAELAEAAEKAGIRVYSSAVCFTRSPNKQSPLPILLGFGGLSPDEIQQGIRQLHRAWLPYYKSP